MRCLHGTEKETCVYCNGYYDKQRELKKNREELSEETKELKERYLEIKRTLKNHWELWTEEEYQTLYENFKSITNIRSKEFRRTVYKVAIELERTRLSIVWKYKYMFLIKDNKKEGKELTVFKRRLENEN